MALEMEMERMTLAKVLYEKIAELDARLAKEAEEGSEEEEEQNKEGRKPLVRRGTATKTKLTSKVTKMSRKKRDAVALSL